MRKSNSMRIAEGECKRKGKERGRIGGRKSYNLDERQEMRRGSRGGGKKVIK